MFVCTYEIFGAKCQSFILKKIIKSNFKLRKLHLKYISVFKKPSSVRSANKQKTFTFIGSITSQD